MTTTLKSVLKLALVAAAFSGAALLGPAFADDDEGGEGGIRAVTNETVKNECSACHMAYPPGLLPQRSWQALMGDLANHFGEDASLDEPVRKEIEDYLVANAADAGGRSIRGLKADQTPLRISELPWFTREHGSKLIARAKSNPKIGSISNCAGCHRGAEQGYFEDD